MNRSASTADFVHLREDINDLWRSWRVVLPPLLFFLVIIAVATIGYLEMGWKTTDALFMVIITVFSVGYGEVQPLDTLAERVWTILVIMGGWTGVLVSLGSVVQAVSQGELRRSSESVRKLRAMEQLQDHVIICGYGRIGQTLAGELTAKKIPYIIIDRDEERIAQINVDGHLSLRGDATEETILIQAGIERARYLATVLPQDALNVFITLTARNLSTGIHIIARGEQLATEKKLLQAGANEVVLPATIGGLRIAHSIIEPSVMNLLRQGTVQIDWHGLGLEVDELIIHHQSHLIGKTVADVQRLGAGSIMVLGVRRGEQIVRQTLSEIVVQNEDALVVLSQGKELPAILSRDIDRTELL